MLLYRGVTALRARGARFYYIAFTPVDSPWSSISEQNQHKQKGHVTFTSFIFLLRLWSFHSEVEARDDISLPALLLGLRLVMALRAA